MSSDEPVELVRGQLQKRDFPSYEQGRFQVEIGARLYEFAAGHRLGRALGRVGIVLTRDPDTVLAPALAFLRLNEAQPPPAQIGFLQKAPNLVVKIVERHARTPEIRERVSFYRAAGVPLLWVVCPGQQRVDVWHQDLPVQVIGVDGVLDGSDVLPGFRLPLADLFG